MAEGRITWARWVNFDLIDTYLRLGWLPPAGPPSHPCTHDHYGLLLTWPCSCPLREPEMDVLTQRQQFQGLPAEVPVIDPDREKVQQARMRPTISTRFGIRLSIVDEGGKVLVFGLTEHDLAHLQLGIASANEWLARARLGPGAPA